ncbi:TylF/MycF/NovP-related O-methyltransferase [Anaerobacterium chartisolvens]|nr:TylF/MycF/NovP-related O-methyltransferase [Anaerobacterium chartisolvens]
MSEAMAPLGFFDRFTNDDKFSTLRCIIDNIKRLGVDEFGSIMLKVFEYASEMKLKGDYLEFGCFGGYTMTWAYKAAKAFGMKDIKFYGFDSFEGLPEIKGVDAEYPEFKGGEFCSTEKQFYKDLKRGGVDISRVVTIPGWYDGTLSDELSERLAVKEAAVILVDCDLYCSTVPVLEFITKYIADGTVILFDDWNCFRSSPEHGEQRAVREWLERYKDITMTKYLPFEAFGQSFIAHRKS